MACGAWPGTPSPFGELGGGFLWIRNVTRPDALLALLVAGTTCAAGLLAPQLSEQGSRLLVPIPAVVTFVILLRLSAGFGLYRGATSAVGVVQGLLLRRARATRTRVHLAKA